MKAVKLMQRVAPQEKGGEIAGVPLLEARRDALGHLVVAGIVGLASSRHQLVTELFERVP